ncbi:hypothetical protein EMIHUDRAFT_259531 [Emiliania huxleyi CCMP1516]|uniref:Uncharacterized protein n=2 Tax=Emiliania huxleyi TaxID=2903 RepID=A0A0D3I020_EMIH1|nr:hypothetical protein EMIHUDRAFT_259531 [Emiliania huxleyi CCMP1516]EOD04605.1 hypothetical protein EMIHUDRAFT_259531 [Emiliania huxleyi CCMP1516]|eukprot:XP_005757034.1 hypothetical protein EMIHUDRAFT_259531 [Emiliania huxleyi CCMP1516]
MGNAGFLFFVQFVVGASGDFASTAASQNPVAAGQGLPVVTVTKIIDHSHLNADGMLSLSTLLKASHTTRNRPCPSTLVSASLAP